MALAQGGRLVIYRKGKPVDPNDFRGVYRLGLPRHDSSPVHHAEADGSHSRVRPSSR